MKIVFFLFFINFWTSLWQFARTRARYSPIFANSIAIHVALNVYDINWVKRARAVPFRYALSCCNFAGARCTGANVCAREFVIDYKFPMEIEILLNAFASFPEKRWNFFGQRTGHGMWRTEQAREWKRAARSDDEHRQRANNAVGWTRNEGEKTALEVAAAVIESSNNYDFFSSFFIWKRIRGARTHQRTHRSLRLDFQLLKVGAHHFFFFLLLLLPFIIVFSGWCEHKSHYFILSFGCSTIWLNAPTDCVGRELGLGHWGSDSANGLFEWNDFYYIVASRWHKIMKIKLSAVIVWVIEALALRLVAAALAQRSRYYG